MIKVNEDMLRRKSTEQLLKNTKNVEGRPFGHYKAVDLIHANSEEIVERIISEAMNGNERLLEFLGKKILQNRFFERIKLNLKDKKTQEKLQEIHDKLADEQLTADEFNKLVTAVKTESEIAMFEECLPLLEKMEESQPNSSDISIDTTDDSLKMEKSDA